MISSVLVSFIMNLDFNDIPPLIREKAKLCFIDFLGVTLRGSIEQSSEFAWKAIKSHNSHIKNSQRFVSILGHGKGSLLDACMINGISCHSLDLDDGHRLAQIHPGCVVIPAALALSEYYDKTGAEFLEAMVAGYEVEIVLGILLNPQHRNQGFHSTGTLGVFGSTVAASKILGLNQQQIINALGLAGTQSCGLLDSDHSGSMGKHLHAGHAAQSGVLSALLAQEGFTGSSSIFESDEGFLKSMCHFNGDLTNLEGKIGSLLGQFHIKDVYFKKYPVCRHLHSSIDSARHISKLLKEENINLDQIKHIKVQTYKIAAEHDNWCPETSLATRQSLPVSLAIALSKGDIRLEDIKAFHQLSPEIKKLTHKVTIETDNAFEDLQPHKRPSRVIVKVNKNEVPNQDDIESTTFLPQGEKENPFSKKEIIDKFHLLNPKQNKSKLALIDNLEKMKIRSLMKTLII